MMNSPGISAWRHQLWNAVEPHVGLVDKHGGGRGGDKLAGSSTVVLERGGEASGFGCYLHACCCNSFYSAFQQAFVLKNKTKPFHINSVIIWNPRATYLGKGQGTNGETRSGCGHGN